MIVSGGFGASILGATNTNGYFSLALTPTIVGGPLKLHFSVTSPSGNYSVSQNTITVTAPIVVPTDRVLEGTTIAGKAGTMPNMAISNPNGVGVGRSQALAFWTGGGSSVFLKPQKGYYDGVDTWTYLNEPKLVPENIKSGVSVFGVTGTYSGNPSVTLSAGDTIIYSYTGHVNLYTAGSLYPNRLKYGNSVTVKFNGSVRIKVSFVAGNRASTTLASILVNGVAVAQHTVKADFGYLERDITVSSGDIITVTGTHYEGSNASSMTSFTMGINPNATAGMINLS